MLSAPSDDLFRMMSFFQSSAGIFFTEWLLFYSLSAFVVCKLMIAMLHIESFFGAGDAFNSAGWSFKTPDGR